MRCMFLFSVTEESPDTMRLGLVLPICNTPRLNYSLDRLEGYVDFFTLV